MPKKLKADITPIETIQRLEQKRLGETEDYEFYLVFEYIDREYESTPYHLVLSRILKNRGLFSFGLEAITYTWFKDYSKAKAKYDITTFTDLKLDSRFSEFIYPRPTVKLADFERTITNMTGFHEFKPWLAVVEKKKKEWQDYFHKEQLLTND